MSPWGQELPATEPTTSCLVDISPDIPSSGKFVQTLSVAILVQIPPFSCSNKKCHSSKWLRLQPQPVLTHPSVPRVHAMQNRQDSRGPTSNSAWQLPRSRVYLFRRNLTYRQRSTPTPSRLPWYYLGMTSPRTLNVHLRASRIGLMKRSATQ